MIRISQYHAVFELFSRLSHSFRTRRVARQLRSYDDFLLRDIGLTRGEVEQAASLSVWVMCSPLFWQWQTGPART